MDAATTTPQRSVEQDRQARIALENRWLRGQRDAAVLESILASDFIHPVVTGDFLTKAQHIYYSRRHVPPANLTNRFDKLSVRIYGAVGIVNGIVVTSDEDGKNVNRTIFTDVFVYRDGQWQAINAQENKVVSGSSPAQWQETFFNRYANTGGPARSRRRANPEISLSHVEFSTRCLDQKFCHRYSVPRTERHHLVVPG